MRIGIIVTILAGTSLQLWSSEKIREFRLQEGVPASEVFLKVESVIDSQTSIDAKFLILPDVSDRRSRELYLVNLTPHKMIEIVCANLKFRFVEENHLYVVAADDQSLFEIRKTLQISNEDILDIAERIEEASMIVVTRNDDGPESSGTGIISKILKGNSQQNHDFGVGQRFPWNSESFRERIFRERMIAGRDGFVIPLTGSRYRERISWIIPYDGEYLRTPQGMSLAELENQVEESLEEQDGSGQPNIHPDKPSKSTELGTPTNGLPALIVCRENERK